LANVARLSMLPGAQVLKLSVRASLLGGLLAVETAAGIFILLLALVDSVINVLLLHYDRVGWLRLGLI